MKDFSELIPSQVLLEKSKSFSYEGLRTEIYNKLTPEQQKTFNTWNPKDPPIDSRTNLKKRIKNVLSGLNKEMANATPTQKVKFKDAQNRIMNDFGIAATSIPTPSEEEYKPTEEEERLLRGEMDEPETEDESTKEDETTSEQEQEQEPPKEAEVVATAETPQTEIKDVTPEEVATVEGENDLKKAAEVPVIPSEIVPVTPPAPTEDKNKTNVSKMQELLIAPIPEEEVFKVKAQLSPEDFAVYLRDVTKYNVVARKLQINLKEYTNAYFEKTVRPLKLKIGELLYPHIAPSKFAYTGTTLPSQFTKHTNYTNTEKDFVHALVNDRTDVVGKILSNVPIVKDIKNQKAIAQAKQETNAIPPYEIEKDIRAWVTRLPKGLGHLKYTAKDSEAYGPGLSARIYQYMMEGILEVVDSLFDKSAVAVKENSEQTFNTYFTELNWIDKAKGLVKSIPNRIIDFKFKRQTNRAKAIEAKMTKENDAKTIAFAQALKMVEVDLVNNTKNYFERYISNLKIEMETTFKEILNDKDSISENGLKTFGDENFYKDAERVLTSIDTKIIKQWGNIIKEAAQEQGIHPTQVKQREDNLKKLFTLPDGTDIREVGKAFAQPS